MITETIVTLWLIVLTVTVQGINIPTDSHRHHRRHERTAHLAGEQHHHHHHPEDESQFLNNDTIIELDLSQKDVLLPSRLMHAGDCMNIAIDTASPPQMFSRREHPVQPPAESRLDGTPIETNKFYANLLIGNRRLPAWTHPYSIWWTSYPSEGIAVSHTTAQQRAYGGINTNNNTAQNFINPTGIESMVFGALEFNDSSSSVVNMTTTNHGPLSVDIDLHMNGGHIRTPAVLGMGMVTAKYEELTPMLTSRVGFRSFSKDASASCVDGTDKYNVELYNGVNWVVYVTSQQKLNLELKDNTIVADSAGHGAVIQVASAIAGAGCQQLYDDTAGAYPVSASVSSQIQGPDTATYSLNYKLSGSSKCGGIVMWALPHHVASMQGTGSVRNDLTMDTTVFGKATAVVGSSITMKEQLPTGLGYLPWDEETGDLTATISSKYSQSSFERISTCAKTEMDSDLDAQSNINSMYFAGKALDKYALIVFTSRYITHDNAAASAGLEKLKKSFAVFANNSQIYPLVYDTTWKGVVSSAGLGDDPNLDFGNSYYSDHHFHYGYFVHCAALIAVLDQDLADGNWVKDNKDFVNTLIRDVANPSSADQYFPQWRMFDWYTGKSWAKGLFPSGDGKDEESGSEDYHFAYGMKLWARAIQDSSMESRADLMLAVMKRSMNLYMMFRDDNTVVPPLIKPNKVSGILFENKMDYATYFGRNPEYIHGIQMIPLTPASKFIRDQQFMIQEWQQKLEPVVSNLTSGWKSILKLNQALFDSQQSKMFFSDPKFKEAWLDQGLSRTWALALAEGI